MCGRVLHARLNTQLRLSSMQNQWCFSTCYGLLLQSCLPDWSVCHDLFPPSVSHLPSIFSPKIPHPTLLALIMSFCLSLLFYLTRKIMRSSFNLDLILHVFYGSDWWPQTDKRCFPLSAADAKFTGRLNWVPNYPKDTGISSQLGTSCSFSHSKPLQGRVV